MKKFLIGLLILAILVLNVASCSVEKNNLPPNYYGIHDTNVIPIMNTPDGSLTVRIDEITLSNEYESFFTDVRDVYIRFKFNVQFNGSAELDEITKVNEFGEVGGPVIIKTNDFNYGLYTSRNGTEFTKLNDVEGIERSENAFLHQYEDTDIELVMLMHSDVLVEYPCYLMLCFTRVSDGTVYIPFNFSSETTESTT